MSQLATLRAQLAAALETVGGTHVYRFVPEAPTDPMLFIEPESPWLDGNDPDEPFGVYRVRFAVTAAVRVGMNDKATDDLDSLVERSIAALVAAGWHTETVSKPYVYASNEALYLAADLAVSDSIQF